MSGTKHGIPVPHPERVIADERERTYGQLVDAARLTVAHLRPLAERLREVGLDHEARAVERMGRALGAAADACLADTSTIEIEELRR